MNTCMIGQQGQYHDGRVDFDVDSLMYLALNKFKMLVESKKLNLPSAKDACKLEAQIVALIAKLEYFKTNKPVKDTRETKRNVLTWLSCPRNGPENLCHPKTTR